MNATKKITRTEVHAGWCNNTEHDPINTPCASRTLVWDIDGPAGLSVYPMFHPEKQETFIEVDRRAGQYLTLHEAAKLSDALRAARAAVLGPEDGKGDDPQTRAVTEAFRMGYAAGQESAGIACMECGQVGQPLRQREVTDEDAVDTRTVWECVDAAGCFGRLREQSEDQR